MRVILMRVFSANSISALAASRRGTTRALHLLRHKRYKVKEMAFTHSHDSLIGVCLSTTRPSARHYSHTTQHLTEVYILRITVISTTL
jgi:hypothetical protein